MKMDLQFRVLHALGRLSGAGKRPVNADDLSRAVGGIAPTTVILSNKFFADAGWIENQQGRYTATDALVEHTRRQAVDGASHPSTEAMEALRVSVRQSWFWEALHPYLANGKLPVTEAAIILMREAAASDSHMPMIMNLLSWLDLIGLITLGDNEISLRDGEAANPQNRAERTEPSMPSSDHGAPATNGTMSEKATTEPGRPAPPHVIAFNFGARLTAEDLAQLNPEQIKALFEAVGTVMALTSKT
jgi:hypothetical protein